MAQAQNTRTFGATIGAALGNAAAYTVHGAVSAAQYTGQFGKDMAAGATDAYSVKSAELSARREQLAEQRGMVAIPEVAKQRRVATAK